MTIICAMSQRLLRDRSLVKGTSSEIAPTVNQLLLVTANSGPGIAQIIGGSGQIAKSPVFQTSNWTLLRAKIEQICHCGIDSDDT